MKKAYRVQINRYLDDAAFEKNIKNIKEYIDVVDEVALFPEVSHHGYYELDEIKEICGVIKRRIDEYKAAGVKRVGINTLCTIGHIDEAWSVLPKPPMQTMVGIDGRASKSCVCPNSDEFIDYIQEKYRIMASVNPDFIWIDDDFRIINHGPFDVCYCDNCIRKFNSEYSLCETFESLTESIKEKKSIKLKWDKFRKDTFASLARVIEQAVHSVDEKIEIGLMSGMLYYDPEWMDAFKATMLRPGGGFHREERPIELIDKALFVGRQIVDLKTSEVNDIQYEFENFPYMQFSKSKTMASLDCALALACGCNGIAFNNTGRYEDNSVYKLAREKADYWDKLSEIFKDTYHKGIYCKDTSYEFPQAFDYRLAEIGLPIAFDKNKAEAFAYTEEDICQMSDEEITKLLSSGVFLDTTGIAELTKRGFSQYCGCEIDNTYDNGMVERFTDDEINSPYEGYIRDPYMNMWFTTVSSLKCVDNNCRVIANLETIRGEIVGPCMTAFENSLGGRVVVSTYMPQQNIKYIEKRRQLQNVFDWLTKSGTCVRIMQPVRVIPFVMQKSDGNTAVLLCNFSYDNTDKFSLIIRNCNKEKFYMLNKDCSITELKAFSGNEEIILEIENIAPFDECVIYSE